MERNIVELFALPRFSSGRRVSLYNQLEEAARRRQLVAILPYLEQARDHDLVTRDLDDRWAAPERKTAYPRGLRRTDAVTDVVMGQFRDIGRAQVADLEPDDPRRMRVENMLDSVFPAGLLAITSLPYVDQVAAVENILVKLRGEFAPVVSELALDRKVSRLVELTAEYREAVDRMNAPLDFTEVRAARDRGHAYMLELVAMIVGIYHDSDNPEHAEGRAALLGLVVEHAESVRALRRRSRNRGEGEPDVDDEEPSDEEPSDEQPVAEEPDAGSDAVGSDAIAASPG